MTDRALPALILSGSRGIGKTQACRSAAGLLASRGLSVGGVLSLSERDAEGVPVAIEAMDIRTGERRLLAKRGARLGGPFWPPGPARHGGTPETEPKEGAAPFGFSEETFAWALELMRRELADGPDLLVLDEVGPLELELELGFHPILALLASRPARTAVLASARPSLAEALAAALAGGRESKVIQLGAADRDSVPAIVAESFGFL